MEHKRSDLSEDHSISQGNKMTQAGSQQNYANGDVTPSSELWTDGLICAFEFIRGHRRSVNSKCGSKVPSRQFNSGNPKVKVPSNKLSEASFPRVDRDKLPESSSLNELRSNQFSPFYDYRDGQIHQADPFNSAERYDGSRWVPIGWARISELVQKVQVDGEWTEQQLDLVNDEDDITVADIAVPYWERPAGPTWWCHVSADHLSVRAWLKSAHWLHPAISLALRDESRLISERMKHLLYEVDRLFYTGHANIRGRINFMNYDASV